ncbi:MAG: RNA-binding S4 domain-containing protein [Deltaproteobacteria bacterium]|nr:RNA-binding S4 domain-containing protein [Deltaproteobacteria bacterium]MBW2659123.1 RNA-binding S4 domain-containing protein [Deltaproteobacteria bacterium]
MSKSMYIEVRNLPIRLGQFLKLANLVQDGVEAKIRIQDGEVMVNSTVETRRGKQLMEGDTITYNGKSRTVRIAPLFQ